MSTHRIARLIERAVADFSLDFSGLTVYTEAATGAYATTAPIAAAAGADEVVAISADSPYGTAADAREQTVNIAEEIGCNGRIRFVSEKRKSDFRQVDVVTNTGFVRPIDDTVVSWLKPTATVPLMFEPWEFRDADIDIRACWRKGVPVLGTDESDDRVMTQHYLGSLAAKLLFEADIEVLNTRVAVVGSGQMAVYTVDYLRTYGADVVHVSPVENTPELEESRDRRRLNHPSAELSTLDAVVVVEHHDDYDILGDWDDISAAELAAVNPSIRVVHVCGALDTEAVAAADLSCLPSDPAPFGSMSYTTGYLGPRPVIDLHAAGLRVGELLARRRRAGDSVEEATDVVAAHSVAADFSEEFKRDYGFFQYRD